jgi:hypothetical protein
MPSGNLSYAIFAWHLVFTGLEGSQVCFGCNVFDNFLRMQLDNQLDLDSFVGVLPYYPRQCIFRGHIPLTFPFHKPDFLI